MIGTTAEKKLKLDWRNLKVSCIYGVAQAMFIWATYHYQYSNNMTSLIAMVIAIGCFVAYTIYDIREWLKIENYSGRTNKEIFLVSLGRLEVTFINWFYAFYIIGVISYTVDIELGFKGSTALSVLLFVLYSANITRAVLKPAWSKLD